MKRETIREFVAQAWCKEKTSDRTMDVELAEAMVDIIMDEIYPAIAKETFEELEK